MVCKREGEALHGLPTAIVVALCMASLACDEARAVDGIYDDRTRALVRLDYDSNRDGRIDVRTYLQGTLPFRTEADSNGDGRIDRWEYLDRHARVVRIGTSMRDDGVEDRWTWEADARGERRVDYARARDNVISRREYYRDEQLVRAEEDANSDGLIDKWEVFENRVLRQVSFDTSYAAGRADRRVIYSASGQFERTESDPERDGSFAPHH